MEENECYSMPTRIRMDYKHKTLTATIHRVTKKERNSVTACSSRSSIQTSNLILMTDSEILTKGQKILFLKTNS